MKDGRTVEVGMVGNEGVVGIRSLLGASSIPYQHITLMSGTAHRMKVAVLKEEFRHGGELQGLLLRYVQARLSQFSQISACNYLHSVTKRVCRWLLMVLDRAMSEELSLTQETISRVLGIHRTGVTETVGALQKRKLIDYHYRRITILDRKGLQRVACECYETISDGFNHRL